MKRCVFCGHGQAIDFGLNSVGSCCTPYRPILIEDVLSYKGNPHKLVVDIRDRRVKQSFEQLMSLAPCSTCNLFEKTEEGIDCFSPLKVLIVNHYTLCNARCAYCLIGKYSDLPQYEIHPILAEMINELGYLDKDAGLCWAGGEPSLYPKDDFRSSLMLAKNVGMSIDVRTNAIVHSSVIAEVLATYDKANVICSIDTSSKDVYKQIKTVDKFEEVLSNLQRYAGAAIRKNQVIVQLIQVPENLGSIDGFLQMAERNGFGACVLENGVRVWKLQRLQVCKPLYL